MLSIYPHNNHSKQLMTMKNLTTCIAALLCCMTTIMAQEKPLRLAIAGISHGHIDEVARRIEKTKDFCVVGIAEPNDELRNKNVLTGKVDESVFYADLEQMLDETKPEAVAAYGSIYDHLTVVEACAPRGIHVMVEKPLATTYKDALKIKRLAEKYGIKVITNYETTWYRTNWHAHKLVKEGKLGDIFRMNIYDGHNGPWEIKCREEFLDWLTDPVLNGGGAVVDFGCYGANIATWFLNGEKPESVYAVLKQHKPEVYPKVDDDATIIVEYPGVTVQIMASWCWPVGRKDMYVYGHDGYIYQKTGEEMETVINGKATQMFKAPELLTPYDDTFRFLRAIVRDQIKLEPFDPNSLENNIMVVQILEAARKSAAKGKVVKIK